MSEVPLYMSVERLFEVEVEGALERGGDLPALISNQHPRTHKPAPRTPLLLPDTPHRNPRLLREMRDPRLRSVPDRCVLQFSQNQPKVQCPATWGPLRPPTAPLWVAFPAGVLQMVSSAGGSGLDCPDTVTPHCSGRV